MVSFRIWLLMFAHKDSKILLRSYFFIVIIEIIAIKEYKGEKNSIPGCSLCEQSGKHLYYFIVKESKSIT